MFGPKSQKSAPLSVASPSRATAERAVVGRAIVRDAKLGRSVTKRRRVVSPLLGSAIGNHFRLKQAGRCSRGMRCKKNSEPKEMFFGMKLISVRQLKSDDHTTERDGSKTVWLHARSINMIICMCSLHCWAGSMARSLGHMQANAESAENGRTTSTPFSILG